MIDYEELSDKNTVHLNLRLFKGIRAQGATSSKANRNTLSRLEKLGLLYFDRKIKRYYMTNYGDQLLRQVEKEARNNRRLQ
jgi:hypothetical protein